MGRRTTPARRGRRRDSRPPPRSHVTPRTAVRCRWRGTPDHSALRLITSVYDAWRLPLIATSLMRQCRPARMVVPVEHHRARAGGHLLMDIQRGAPPPAGRMPPPAATLTTAATARYRRPTQNQPPPYTPLT